MTPDDIDFLQAIRATPLVSIDLIVRDGDGRILAGMRRNEPARGTWFVPGGRIRKDETLASALARISHWELGVTFTADDVRFAGVYEHFYDTNFTGSEGISTHYVVLAYVVERTLDTNDLPCGQHSDWTWLSQPALANVHPNTLAYLEIR
ncbi:MAG: GDP-mannose mannosyl hydrolase [Gammaproteobacteria bacterium]